MPGHMLVFFVTDQLLSLGKPGFDLDEKLETESDDIWFNIPGHYFRT